MDLSTILQKVFLEGFSSGELSVTDMMLCLGFAALLGVYICVIYRMTQKNAFQSRGFRLSLVALSVITAAIILTIQSNIVVSLGMVGALSIVRFRTAVKEAQDLIFLFWSISAGIICGAGFAVIAVIASAIVTIVLVVFSFLPQQRDSLILVVNTRACDQENDVLRVVKHACSQYRVRARTANAAGLNLAIEVRTRRPAALLEELMGSEFVVSASLVEHDGEVTA